MPTYEYACTACAQHIEVVQSMSDEPLRECGNCGGTLRKVFSPIGIVFKGSGFYRNDSRAGAGRRNGASSTSPDNGAKSDSTASTASSSSESSSSTSKSTSEKSA